MGHDHQLSQECEFEIEEALKLHCKIRENQGMRSLFQVSRSVSETRKFKV